MKILKDIIYPLAIISGTIIGVGIFSLPYIASKVGLEMILFYFLVLGALVILIHSFFAQLAVKTADLKRLPGFAKIYLGKWGERIALLSIIFGLFGAILAYLIVGGEFLSELFSPILGGNTLIYTLFYFLLGAVLIYFGIRIISKIEFWGLILFFLLLIVVYWQSHTFIKIEHFIFKEVNLPNLFLPYGPILFSLWGAALIPEIEEMLSGGKKRLLRIIIPLATLIPVIIYLFFIYLILGITGPQTTQSALVGLRDFLPSPIVSLVLFFGFLTTFTSFIALGLTLKKVFWYDLKLKKNLAWALTCFLPLILFLIGIKNFIGVISFVGGVMLGIDGTLILLMYRRLALTENRKKMSFLVLPLILIFVFGIIYEVVYFLK
jgi:tyrosine-specific transport protein